MSELEKLLAENTCGICGGRTREKKLADICDLLAMELREIKSGAGVGQYADPKNRAAMALRQADKIAKRE